MKDYENFIRALRNLEDINNYEEPYNNVIITGLVGLYRICFEQCCKAMKEILEMHGFQESKVASPRNIIKIAYKEGMIDDEKSWLGALVARNNVVHAYNKAIALYIVTETKNTYVPMFMKLEETLKEDWILEENNKIIMEKTFK